MRFLRVIATTILLATVAFSAGQPALSQSKHWLLGSWEGGRKNVGPTSRTGTDRTLIVKSVSPDGSSAKGTWVVSTANVNLTIAISGDVVTFTTPGSTGAFYQLSHHGDVLEGTWKTSGSGHGGAIELKKK